jgi:hypothetical protein
VDYEEERYVRLFVRNTPTWCGWKWEARATIGPLLRALWPSGRIEWKPGTDAACNLAAVLMLPVKVVAAGVREMERTDTVEIGDGWIEMPNYVEGQNAKSRTKTGAERAAECRARKASKGTVVTRCNEPSQNVAAVTNVTPSPCLPLPPNKPASPSALPVDPLVAHVLGEMQAACRELNPQAAGPTDCKGNRKLIAKCMADTSATPEQWTHVIRAQLASVRGQPQNHRYLALSTLCVPANFLRLLDAPVARPREQRFDAAPIDLHRERAERAAQIAREEAEA